MREYNLKIEIPIKEKLSWCDIKQKSNTSHLIIVKQHDNSMFFRATEVFTMFIWFYCNVNELRIVRQSLIWLGSHCAFLSFETLCLQREWDYLSEMNTWIK